MKRHGITVSERRKARHYAKPSREKRNESKRRAAVTFMLNELSLKTPEERAREHASAERAFTKPPKKRGKK